MPTMTHPKIVKLEILAKITQQLKKNGKKIVHCHGVFDLLHPGHVRHFQSAKKHGDILVVTISADKFVKKGPGRPAFNENLRAEVLASLAIIDYVAIVYADSAIEAIKKVKPTIYVKGPDYKYRKTNPQLPRKLSLEEDTVKAYGGTLVFTDDEIVFSSSRLINQYLESYPNRTKLYLSNLRKFHSAETIADAVTAIKNKKILIIGDTIIDQYHYTESLGKSSKEPVLVHQFIDQEIFAGGTLATANHVAAFNDHIHLLTLLGKRPSFERFITKSLRSQIKPVFFYQANGHTIVDRRYIDQTTHQKLFQICFMQEGMLQIKIEEKISDYLKKEVANFDLVIVNDFGRGLITKKMIRIICKKSKFLALNVQANSANYGFNIVTKYPKADFVCLDEHELRLATHDKHSDLLKLIKKVAKKLRCKELIVTRGASGSISYAPGMGTVEAPALSQSVVDRVGAGDAFFAIAALSAYIGMNQTLVSFVGNVAGALKVQSVGHRSPIELKEFTKFITRLLK